MLVIVGSGLHAEPWALAGHWRGREVGIVTPADLSIPGWRYRPGDREDTTIVVQGQVLSEATVTGVVSTLPWVTTHDLAHIVERDRDYVAAEMTAFLLAWLSQLRCPVLERPSPMSLAGCILRDWQWISLARRLGIDAPAPELTKHDDLVDVTVLAGRAIEAPTAAHAHAAERLADAAGRCLVTLTFTRSAPTLVAVKRVPAVSSAAVAGELLTWLEQ